MTISRLEHVPDASPSFVRKREPVDAFVIGEFGLFRRAPVQQELSAAVDGDRPGVEFMSRFSAGGFIK
jgi:hypothetical protein